MEIFPPNPLGATVLFLPGVLSLSNLADET